MTELMFDWLLTESTLLPKKIKFESLTADEALSEPYMYQVVVKLRSLKILSVRSWSPCAK